MKSGSDLAGGGVLVRQFDTLSNIDDGKPWQPCSPTRWCSKFHSQWPASVINSKVRKLYYPHEGGFVFDTTLVDIFCMYPGDGDSMSNTCGGGPGGKDCVPGCHTPMFPGCSADYWKCTYPPTRLREGLESQLVRRRDSHNEFVIDTRSIKANLPRVIRALFYIQDRARASNARLEFLREFELSEKKGPPLVRISLGAPTGHVFTLAS